MSHSSDRATTLAELLGQGYRSRTVKEELRENLLTVLRAQGTAFPGIVGFDDTALASMISPRLTTVHLPVAEAGRVAVGLLLDLLRGLPSRLGPVELPVELIVRSSTGTAPEVTS